MYCVKLGSEEGQISSDEYKILHSVFLFSNKLIKDVMMPRHKIFAIDCKMSQADIIKFVQKGKHTRYPVFEDTPDNIKGFVYTKDILNMLVNKNLIILQNLIRKPFFVDENAKVPNILKKLQQERQHIAIVKNAKGNIVGLVTLEDMLEEIVGEIEDE